MSFCPIKHHHCEPRLNLGRFFLSSLVSCLTPWIPFNIRFFPICGNYNNYSLYNSVFTPPPTYDYTLSTSQYKYVDRFQFMPYQNSMKTVNYANSTSENVGFDTFTSTVAHYNSINTNYQTPIMNYGSIVKNIASNPLNSSSSSSSNPKTLIYSKEVTGDVDNSYRNCTTIASAEEKAKTDTKLESLKNGGKGWRIAEESFRTDIPYAKKGTGNILTKVSEEIGLELVVTSALGTGAPNNPHKKDGYKSHHNAMNPKLDISVPAGMTAETLANKLKGTGYFSHILAEGDHVDVQIDPDKYEIV